MRSLSRSTELGVLTGAKAVSNLALRWVGVFLPTLERAFGATTGTMTGVMGVAELGGFSTVVTGRALDRGHERRFFQLGLIAIAASSLIALAGSVTTFAVSFVVLIVGVNHFTIAGHAWIGHRVPYRGRSRAIGIFETSWAISLLVGAPILALLIRWVGWRGPYVALAVACALAALVVRVTVAASEPAVLHGTPTFKVRLPPSAWPPMLASASTAATGIGILVVSGTWLDDAHGVSTAGLGLIAAGFGAVELASSSAVAMIADRHGARRSVIAGLLLVGAGVAAMAVSGQSPTVAVIGLLVFLAGFEYAFVASLTLVTEAAPEARGRAIGISNSFGTIARAGAVVASGQLYEAFGMTGSLVLVTVTATVAIALIISVTDGVRHHLSHDL